MYSKVIYSKFIQSRVDQERALRPSPLQGGCFPSEELVAPLEGNSYSTPTNCSYSKHFGSEINMNEELNRK